MKNTPHQSRTRIVCRGDKSYQTHLNGNTVEVTVSATNQQQPQTKRRTFNDPEAAYTWVQQQERKKLREGYIINNKAALVGEPIVVMYINSTYTGLLPIATYSSGLLTAYTDSDQQDVIVDIDVPDVFEVIKFDGGMVSKILEANDTIYVLANHQVFAIDENAAVLELTAMGEWPASALEIAGGKGAWLHNDELQLTDLKTNTVVWSQSIKPALYEGHTPQFVAALSERYLVYCDTPGVVVAKDLQSDALSSFTVDVHMIQQMIVVGQRLYISEMYGNWGVYCYDIASEALDEDWTTLLEREQHPLAVSHNQRYLAIGRGSRVSVFDLKTHEEIQTIDIDYAVKRTGFVWTDDNHLALRLDSGHLSVYRIF